jgi:CheY-like chemotaxis protein
MSILVVDDQPEIRTMFTTLFEDEGYSVVCAAHGREALDYLHQTTELPGVILLDLAMPIMTGWEFIREQQCDPVLAPIPVILMTARGYFEQDGAGIYAAYYLPKPTDLDRILSAVRALYGRELSTTQEAERTVGAARAVGEC